MIKVLCQYSALSELSVEVDLDPYKEFVKPLAYDFCLERNKYYQVIGFVQWKGTPWIYVTLDDISEIQIVPAIMFSMGVINIPVNYVMRMTNSSWPNLEILPQELAKIDDWYELYINGDEKILSIVEKLIK